MVFRLSWLGAQTKATGGKAAEGRVPFIYLEDCYSWAGTALENSLCVQLIKRELDPKVKWHNIVCFEQRLFTVRRWVSNALGCSSAVFSRLWDVDDREVPRGIVETFIQSHTTTSVPLVV